MRMIAVTAILRLQLKSLARPLHIVREVSLAANLIHPRGKLVGVYQTVCAALI